MSKTKTQITLDETLAKELRVLAAEHNLDNSTIAATAFRHCFGNRHFLDKLKAKSEKEPQF